jgi:hypothetical protein
VIPPDPRPAWRATYRELDRLVQAERDLETGDGVWQGTDVGRAARWLDDLRADRLRCEEALRRGDVGWQERRRLRSEIERGARAEETAVREFEQLVQPVRGHLASKRLELEQRVTGLNEERVARNQWLDQHPEAEYRVAALTAELYAAERTHAEGLELEGTPTRQVGREAIIEPRAPAVEADLGLDLGV